MPKTPVHEVVHIAAGIKIHARSDGSEVEGGRFWFTRTLETVKIITSMVGYHHDEAVDVRQDVSLSFWK